MILTELAGSALRLARNASPALDGVVGAFEGLGSQRVNMQDTIDNDIANTGDNLARDTNSAGLNILSTEWGTNLSSQVNDAEYRSTQYDQGQRQTNNNSLNLQERSGQHMEKLFSA